MKKPCNMIFNIKKNKILIPLKFVINFQYKLAKYKNPKYFLLTKILAKFNYFNCFFFILSFRLK